MIERYNNKYRIPSARLPHWDYQWPGAYFITICTRNRHHFFGRVTDGKMQLSDIGGIAENNWAAIQSHFPRVELGEFIVMPNHVHGIVIIPEINNGDVPVETLHATSLQNANATSLQNANATSYGDSNATSLQSSISPKPGSISTIIRSYKSSVTMAARNIDPSFAWQARFYDHIIRDEESYCRITEYIANNPRQWREDDYYE